MPHAYLNELNVLTVQYFLFSGMRILNKAFDLLMFHCTMYILLSDTQSPVNHAVLQQAIVFSCGHPSEILSIHF